MADVVYLVRDLLFTSKIRETARQLGASAEAVRDLSSLLTAARAARLVIVDLRLPEALSALESLAADPAAPKGTMKTVGFIDHEKLDVMEAARQRGCTLVLPKGKLSSDLPKLIAAAAAAGQPG